ncbi:MAG: hypothetical protein CMH52_13845, partial [Myxococcales bacterium]|nr:hypothetical protein [Myxococcales bacterium]
DESFIQADSACGVGACVSAGRTSCVAGAIQDSCVPGQAADNDAVCDGIDDDCDGRTDENFGVEATNCGVGACAADGANVCRDGAVVDTCVPGQAAANDATCDGIDDDCDGRTDESFVQADSACGVGACVSAGRTSCVAGAVQDSCVPGQAADNDAVCDGNDDDCDGRADENFAVAATTCGVGACGADGERICRDGAVVDTCAPGQAAANDATCDGIDDDCDGRTDESFVQADSACGVGACVSAGRTSCVAGATQDSCVPGQAADDDTTCDGVDDDCDGRTDESFAVAATACGVGACDADGERICRNGAVVDTCAPGQAAANDATCDGIDDDCDGRTDETFVARDSTCGLGACAAAGRTRCLGGIVQDSCQPGDPAITDGDCDGIDDDCDGRLDEDDVNNCDECVVASDEICDDRDNDCDGETDENPDAGNCVGEACGGNDVEQGVQFSKWQNVAGTSIAQLRAAAAFPDAPDEESVLDTMEIRANQGNSYGARLRCFLVPSESNTYRFYIASDDNGELAISQTADLNELEVIATVSSWTASRQWDRFDSQESDPIALEAGQVYALQALMNEGGGGDNLSVAWSTGNGQPQLITSEHCYPEPPNLVGPGACDQCDDSDDCLHPVLAYCANGACSICEPDTNAGCGDGLECVDGECRAPQTCSNGVLDEGETSVDCGGLCGLCADGAACGTDDECNSGQCDQGACRHIVDFCRLDAPYDRQVVGEENVSVNGVFGEAGLTDQSRGVDADPRIRVQLGYGPDNTDPSTNGQWTWRNMAARNGFDDGGQSDAGRDGYTASFGAPNQVTRFDFAMRVSASRGQSWTYCDRGPLGSSDGYDTRDAGQLNITELAASCEDGRRNQDESDVDCGGATCPGCVDGQRCSAARDCEDNICTGRVCQSPSCDDFARNGDETDTDCGGPECDPCFQGQRCQQTTDCRDQVCGADRRCSAPACDDGVQNGQEAGTDCGGNCPGCGDGAECTRNSDCLSDFCDWRNNRCGQPWFEQTCFDEANGNWALSLAVDDLGVVHVSRIRRLSGDLVYTRIGPDGVKQDTVVAEDVSTLGGDEVSDTDITLFNGRPAIAFRNNDGRYEVAIQEQGQWRRSTVIENASAGFHCEVAVANGQLVTAFTQGRNLRFGTRQANGQWQLTTIDSIFRSVGREADLAIWNDEPVIAHRDFTLGQLRISRRSGNQWTTRAIAAQNGEFGFRPTVMVIDEGIRIFHGTVPDEPDQSGDGVQWYVYGPLEAAEYQQFSFDNNGAGGGQAIGVLNDNVAVFSRRRQRSALFGAQDGLLLWINADSGRQVELELAGSNDQRRRYQFLNFRSDPFGLPVLLYSDDRTAAGGEPDVSRFCIYRAADQDGDYLPDPFEADYGTDPLQADTDGDGRSDGEEYLIDGTDARGCTNGQRNGTETDIDCGGVCPGCDLGQLCLLGSDCSSTFCENGRCANAPDCNDGVANGAESDVDCGGATCGPCDDGSVCASDDDCLSDRCVNARCTRALTPPGIDGLTAYYDPETHGLGILVTGSDLDSDVSGFRLALESADGVNRLGADGPVDVPFDQLSYAGASLEGRFSINYDDLLRQFGQATNPRPDFDRVSVILVDEAGFTSPELSVAPSLPPIVGRDGACDPNAGLNRCAADDYCFEVNAANGDTHRCLDSNTGCPDGRASLNDTPSDFGWQVDGTIDAESPANQSGSCGGGFGYQVYEFTAPAAADYIVTVQGLGINALRDGSLHIRKQCGVQSTESGCFQSDNTGQIRAVLALDANETIFVFVDNRQALLLGAQADFRLSVETHLPPTLESVDGWFNRENGATSLDIGGSRQALRVQTLQFQYLNAQGQVLSLAGQAGPFQQQVNVDEAAPNNGAIQLTGRSDFNRDPAADERQRITGIRVALIDELNLASNGVDIDFQEPAPVGLRAACDSFNARTVCQAGAECFVRDPMVDGQSRCYMTADFCPQEWQPESLEQSAVDWKYWSVDRQHDSGEARDQEHGFGFCGAGLMTGQNDLYSFTVPFDGDYQISTLAFGQTDTIMFVRRQCGVETRDAEIGCNDDEPGEPDSLVSIDDAQAGDVLYIFVDSAGGRNRGQYRLDVRYVGDCQGFLCELCDGQTNEGCPAGRPFCNADGTDCFECLGDANCARPDLSQCVDGSCQLCRIGTDAGCPANTPFCVGGDRCIECQGDADCADPSRPSCREGACEACDLETNAGCAGQRPVCALVAGTAQCVQCNGDANCQDPNTPECVSNRCTECDPQDNGGCGNDAPVCILDGLAERCVVCNPADHDGCQGETAFCTADGTQCVGCRADGDCGGEQCVQDTCQFCDPADHAGCGGQTPFCQEDGGACVGCRGDGDCPDGQCVDAQCVACDPIDNAGCPAARPFCRDGGAGLTCIECIDDASCGDPARSQCLQGACLVCDSADNAGCGGVTPICADVGGAAACVECTDSGQCNRPGLGECVANQCQLCVLGSNAGCGDDTPVCINDGDGVRCVGCQGDGDCNGGQCVAEQCQVCDPADDAG